MSCLRCQGLLWPLELRDEAGGLAYDAATAYRCVMCGDLTDSVIITNRILSATGQTPRKGRTRFHRRGMRLAGSKPSAANVS